MDNTRLPMHRECRARWLIGGVAVEAMKRGKRRPNVVTMAEKGSRSGQAIINADL
jgi:hypothetical protein